MTYILYNVLLFSFKGAVAGRAWACILSAEALVLDDDDEARDPELSSWVFDLRITVT